MAKRILIVFGTRPEAIKMAPVFRALSVNVDFEVKVCVTAQHRSMLDQVLSLFEIKPDFDLNLMSVSQTLEGISARILEALSKVLDEWIPDMVLVHGDTVTTSMTSVACFYKRIPVGHVEAGLRTGNLNSPWPEEMNRRVAGLIARLHFAPTQGAAANLLEEKVSPESVVITGNTVIDALIEITERLNRDDILSEPLRQRFSFINEKKKIVLVTGHRRENFGSGMRDICNALLKIARRVDVQVVYAVHLNPNVKVPVEAVLADQPNIHLIPPQDYLSFVFLMMHSHIILTDSGGIQEEAPSLGKPVLVMRDTTERPEAVVAGTARLVGTDSDAISDAITELLDDPQLYSTMSSRCNPYGNGQASNLIVASLSSFFAGQNAGVSLNSVVTS